MLRGRRCWPWHESKNTFSTYFKSPATIEVGRPIKIIKRGLFLTQTNITVTAVWATMTKKNYKLPINTNTVHVLCFPVSLLITESPEEILTVGHKLHYIKLHFYLNPQHKILSNVYEIQSVIHQLTLQSVFVFMWPSWMFLSSICGSKWEKPLMLLRASECGLLVVWGCTDWLKQRVICKLFSDHFKKRN